jgi:hypothetical protein
VQKDMTIRCFTTLLKANLVADALRKKSLDGKIDSEVLVDQLAQKFTIMQIDEVLIGGPPIMSSPCCTATMPGYNQSSIRK